MEEIETGPIAPQERRSCGKKRGDPLQIPWICEKIIRKKTIIRIGCQEGSTMRNYAEETEKRIAFIRKALKAAHADGILFIPK